MLGRKTGRGGTNQPRGSGLGVRQQRVAKPGNVTGRCRKAPARHNRTCSMEWGARRGRVPHKEAPLNKDCIKI